MFFIHKLTLFFELYQVVSVSYYLSLIIVCDTFGRVYNLFTGEGNDEEAYLLLDTEKMKLLLPKARSR